MSKQRERERATDIGTIIRTILTKPAHYSPDSMFPEFCRNCGRKNYCGTRSVQADGGCEYYSSLIKEIIDEKRIARLNYAGRLVLQNLQHAGQFLREYSSLPLTPSVIKILTRKY